MQKFFHQHLPGVAGKGPGERIIEILLVLDDAAALSSQSECAPQHDRQSNVERCPPRLLDALAGSAPRCLDVDLGEPLLEPLSVLGIANGLDGSSQDPHAVACEHASVIERQPAVQSRLAAEGQQDGIDLLLDDDLLDEIRLHRDQIDAVGQPFAGLNGGDVRIDQNRFDRLFLERLDGLGA